jgi:predicted N-acyltransferase
MQVEILKSKGNQKKQIQSENSKMQRQGITSRSIMTLRVCKQLWHASGRFFTKAFVLCKGKMRS